MAPANRRRKQRNKTVDQPNNINNSSSRSRWGNHRRERGQNKNNAPEGKGRVHKAQRRHYQKQHRTGGPNHPNRIIKEEPQDDYHHSRKAQRKRVNSKAPSSSSSSYESIRISSSSIHSSWKRELGGLIRYFINDCCSSSKTKADAEREIEGMYIRSGCSIDDTKLAIVRAIEDHHHHHHHHDRRNANGPSGGSDADHWIDIDMAIEHASAHHHPNTTDAISDAILTSYSPTVDSRGVKLPKTTRAGEGPAHSHQRWTNVVVPPWAVGRSFFFQVHNRSALDLSCEMTLDGEKVARNVPVPRKSARTVRPDCARYFQTHVWLLDAAKRVPFGHLDNPATATTSTSTTASTTTTSTDGYRTKPPPKRYNNVRPDYNAPDRPPRVDIALYPDPRAFGWTFTGSVPASLVEFYEKNTNMGIVKLDFYYTTATIKTVLCHPTTGKNQLFRNRVGVDMYEKILREPRVHTGRGYRYQDDRVDHTVGIGVGVGDGGGDLEDGVDLDMKDWDDDDQPPDEHMQTSETNNPQPNNKNTTTNTNEQQQPNNQNTTYYARNDHYDFQKEGHAHRRTEMHKLQHTHEYNAWHRAAKQEYAVLHAKFYVALVDRVPHQHRPQHDHHNRNHRNNRHHQRKEQREPLPEQATIVDVKAAEKATLGTKFHPLPSNGPDDTSRRIPGRSRVRTKRIEGLDDDPQYTAAPLFEYKLYYRAQEVLLQQDDTNIPTDGDDSDDAGNEIADDGCKPMDTEQDHNNNNNNNANYHNNGTLEQYKREKSNQVAQYHVENKTLNPEEAEDMLAICRTKINLATSVQDVDELVGIYHDHLVRGQFHGDGGGGGAL